MSQPFIHSCVDLADVSWREDLGAVYIKWHSEYNEGLEVKNTVLAAIKYVNDNNVLHWVADISESTAALSEADYAWVSSEEFKNLIRNSSLKKFVLIPPLPETGQDTSWLAEWEANTLKAFGDDVSAKVADDMDEIRKFFDVS